MHEDHNAASRPGGAPAVPDPAANADSLVPPPRTRWRQAGFRVAALLLALLSIWALWDRAAWTLGAIVTIPFIGLMLVHGLAGWAPDFFREDAVRSARADWRVMRGERRHGRRRLRRAHATRAEAPKGRSRKRRSAVGARRGRAILGLDHLVRRPAATRCGQVAAPPWPCCAPPSPSCSPRSS